MKRTSALQILGAWALVPATRFIIFGSYFGMLLGIFAGAYPSSIFILGRSPDEDDLGAYPELFVQVVGESARLSRSYSTSSQAPTFRRSSSRAPSG